MSTVVVVIIIIVVIVIMFSNFNQTKNGRKILEDSGYNINKRIEFGTFIGGHPNINEPIKNGYLISDGNNLAICNRQFIMFGKISKSEIKNVVFEDATTFGHGISARRILLLGVFALAWQKKTTNEQAYITIEWNDGKFDHDSVFFFEGIDSNPNANQFRNSIIKWAR